MDKDKKKIIVGVGIAGAAGLVYLLTRKKPPITPVCTPGDTKCIGSDLCVCNAKGTNWDVSVKDSPTCAVTPGTVVLYGKVTDASTGVAIEGIQESCNSYSGTTEADGQYRIENITPGDYTITFTDPSSRYETKEVSVTLTEGLNKLDAALEPIPALALASLEGKVTDDQSGAALMGIAVGDKISHAGETVFGVLTGADGQYRVEGIVPGDYTIMFHDEQAQYEAANKDITLKAGENNLDIALRPYPPVIGWTDGVTVIDIRNPGCIALGDRAWIGVDIYYEGTVPATISGIVYVNGVAVTGTYAIVYQDCSPVFRYAPPALGMYTVTAMDKSATLAVRESMDACRNYPYG